METWMSTEEGMAAYAEPAESAAAAMPSAEAAMPASEERTKILAVVEVNLPQKEIKEDDVSSLLIEVTQFMDALGFVFDSDEDTVVGSFFKKLKFWSKKALTSEEAEQLYEEGKDALRLKLLDNPTAEATGKMAGAAGTLLEALKPFDEAVVRTGALLVIKLTIGEKSRVIVETVSPNLMHELESNPMLLKNPDALHEFLVEKGVTGEIVDDDSEDLPPTYIEQIPKTT